jgi:DNA-binding CsgD family transcriptional regulator
MAQAWALTKTEQAVCRLLAEGRAPQEIAGELDIKPGSVYRHLVTIREKLECDHLVALVAKVCASRPEGSRSPTGAPAATRWPRPEGTRRRRVAEKRQLESGQIALFLDV